MAAIKVTLRQKKITDRRKSLYLDFYPAIVRNGKETRREFLKMYILEKPKTPIDKAGNTETLRLAEAIRQKRENELNLPNEVLHRISMDGPKYYKIVQTIGAAFADFLCPIDSSEDVNLNRFRNDLINERGRDLMMLRLGDVSGIMHNLFDPEWIQQQQC